MVDENQATLTDSDDVPDSEEDLGTYHENNQLNDLTGKEWIKFTKSWKVYKPRSRKEDEVEHPAKFPEELVQDFVRFFTKEGDWVLDPFLGTGSTLVGCRSTGRNGVGIELNEKYANVAKDKISQQSLQPVELEVVNGDAFEKLDELDRKFDYCLTSPPYWDMLSKSRGGVKSNHQKREEEGLDTEYSEKEDDIGNIHDYDEFLDALEKLFRKVYDLLREDAYLTVVLQNMRDEDGEMKPLAWDVGKRLGEFYTLKQEKLWLQDDKQ
ncbi:MAG: DNA methyltransferase, partial [Halobacteriaceae archaeon]